MNHSREPDGLPDEPQSLGASLLKAAIEARRLTSSGPEQGAAGDDGNALSYPQERFWFLHQLDPGGYAENTSQLMHIRGRLNQIALEASLREVQRRHAVLRTTFHRLEGKPVARIGPGDAFALQVVDFTTTAAAQNPWEQAPAREFISEELKRPFDLAEGPLWRAILLLLDEEQSLLLVVMNHIVGDGLSWPVFERELGALYEAFDKKEASPLPELLWQYSDYAKRQRTASAGDGMTGQLSYWEKQLSGIEELRLPRDFPQLRDPTYDGAKVSLALPQEFRANLDALSRREGVTFFMIMLAAYQLLLARLSGQEDITVGSPIANRDRQAEELIGCFINNIALRTDLSGDPTFLELLARVRKIALEAYTNQSVPFEKLLETFQPQRILDQTRYFNVYINEMTLPSRRYELPGLTIEVLPKPRLVSQFDMTLYIRSYGMAGGAQQTNLELVYKAGLFSAERMQQILAQYTLLLQQILNDPDKPVSAYSLVTPSAKQMLPDPCALLSEPNQKAITEMIAGWARRTPETTAVEMGEVRWTYRQLHKASFAMAEQLLGRGMQQGDVVALRGTRSFGLISSMTGILTAGGVLLTIDPNLPAQRQALMLREAGAVVLVDTGGANLAAGEIATLYVDPTSGQPVAGERFSAAESMPKLAGSDPAYIFFTSGTTGTPKAVLGNHKGLSHFLDWQRTQFAISPTDRAGQLTGLSFDVILRDVLLPLTSGATLVLPPAEIWEAEQLLGWFKQKKITVMNVVPSLAQTWLASATPVDGEAWQLADLRWTFFAGEPLYAGLVQQWRHTLGTYGQLVNFYGPTETTMVKSFYQLPDEVLPGVQPVGHPLPQTHLLLICNGRLCGIGEVGEIVIRTPFRTDGYINAPQEAKRFAKNPYREDEDDLLYFTGDRGRYRPDGSMEILGRLDDQIKIRGVRIQPVEIEALLEQHPSVKQAVVVAHDGEQDKRLAAYIVSSGALEEGQLRNYASARLPAAMIPSHFVQVKVMPLTANGKVDRKALSGRELEPVDLADSYAAPRTAYEATLVQIWTDVLGVERVGIYDNFFELGGHSLLAMQILGRILQKFQVDVAVRAMFEGPTVAEMAKAVLEAQVASLGSDAIDRLLAGPE